MSIVASFCLTGCEGDEVLSDPPPLNGPDGIELISGDGQSGLPGAMLSEPFVVLAADAWDRPVPGVRIYWHVYEGGGSLSDDMSVTNERGLAETHFTLGKEPGENVVAARLASMACVFPLDCPVTIKAVAHADEEPLDAEDTDEPDDDQDDPGQSDDDDPAGPATLSNVAGLYIGQEPDEFDHLSQYELREDRSFDLHYLTGMAGSYSGTYSLAGSELTFNFAGWSSAGPWQATGTLDGDTLTVEYNIIMWLSDFRPGTYVLDAGAE